MRTMLLAYITIYTLLGLALAPFILASHDALTSCERTHTPSTCRYALR
jgi:hypothetical protein